jgi:hypothetical protein
MEFENMILREYNRLLKIDEACKALPTTTKETMSMKLVKAGEFNLVVYTDPDGAESVAGSIYYNAEFDEYLFAPRVDIEPHFSGDDLLDIVALVKGLRDG